MISVYLHVCSIDTPGFLKSKPRSCVLHIACKTFRGVYICSSQSNYQTDPAFWWSVSYSTRKKKEQKLFSTVLRSVCTFQPFRNHLDAPFQTHSPSLLLHLAAFRHLLQFPLLAGELVAWLWPLGALTQILSILFLYPRHGSASESPSKRNKPQQGLVSLSHFRVFKSPS